MKVSIPQAEDYHNEFSIISVKRSFTLCARYIQISVYDFRNAKRKTRIVWHMFLSFHSDYIL